MKVTIGGATFVRAERAVAWAALHDVDLVAQCILGCQSLVRVSDQAYRLLLSVRLGPIRVIFEGDVTIAESDPPHGFRLVGRGTSQRVGGASGRAAITLIEQPGGCKLVYDVEASTHGAVSVAGSRLLSGVGRAIATVFATRFGELVDDGRKSHRVAALQRA